MNYETEHDNFCFYQTVMKALIKAYSEKQPTPQPFHIPGLAPKSTFN